jgi:glycosyltransferase involved in cell wall biosynthesis
MPRSIVVFHVLNKRATGGAENLVHGLVLWSADQNTALVHREIYIAKSRFATTLLSKKLIRFLPIFFAYIKLILTYLDFSLINHRKVFIFHLAECHFLARIFSLLTPGDNKTRLIVYLHQSHELFPTKLRPTTESLIRNFHTICYSKRATDTWFQDLVHQPKQRSVLHNSVPIKNLPIRTPREDLPYLNLLFVGRYVQWKRPDMALAIAQKLSDCFPVRMIFAGISESEYCLDYGKLQLGTSQLDVQFHGIVKDVAPLLQEAHLLLNLAESSTSGEGIGIAAMEALMNGIPVLVQDRSKTDFLNMPGIYDIRDLDAWLWLVREQPDPLDDFRVTFSMDVREKELWKAKVSIDRYNSELASILEYVFAEKRNEK